MQESAGPGQNPALAAARIWFVSWGWSFPGEAPPPWPQPPCGVYGKVLIFS